MDTGGLLQLAVIVVGLAGIGGGAVAVLRSRQIKDSFELTMAANAELRAQNAEQERRCNDRITHLEGQVAALESTIVDGLVAKVEAGIERAVLRAGDR